MLFVTTGCQEIAGFEKRLDKLMLKHSRDSVCLLNINMLGIK